MLFQSQFSVIAGVLAMFHGFDSHCCDSVTLTLPDTIPPPAGNYCFESRAKTCSECLQAGKGCAYCSEEVRAENSCSIK